MSREHIRRIRRLIRSHARQVRAYLTAVRELDREASPYSDKSARNYIAALARVHQQEAERLTADLAKSSAPKQPVCRDCWHECVFDARKLDTYRPKRAGESCVRCSDPSLEPTGDMQFVGISA